MTEALHDGEFVSEFQGCAVVAQRRVRMVYQAAKLDDLARFPGNRFEKLKGNRAGQYSVRINDQWRVCFTWNHRAEEIEIIDYH